MAAKMITVDTLEDLLTELLNYRNHQIGFVPTMGALHAGHLSLVNQARRENDRVVVSVFVNPTQFNDPRDLERYPRTREADLELLQRSAADLVWFPNSSELYPDEFRYRIQENEVSATLCGKSRPGHFSGMLTVVLKLLQIVRPARAYFGEKDYQQLRLVKGLCEAFFIPTTIVACPIVRDSRGLALSSRNARLSPKGLETARSFAQIFADTNREIEDVRHELQSLPLTIDYLEDRFDRRFAAVEVDGIRLIDNRPLTQISRKETTL
jgi:pantoate--beta-alanine ligase